MSGNSTATLEHKAIVQAFAEACRFGGDQERIDTGAALFLALAASSAKTAEVLVTDAANDVPLQGLAAYLRFAARGLEGRPSHTALIQWAGEVDAATRAQAVSLPAESVWLPIETAPKGRKLIVGYPNKLGNWRTITGCYYPPQTLQMADDSGDLDDDGYAPEGWYEESETQDSILRTDEIPTHWMPLPCRPPAPDSAPVQTKE